MDKVPVFIKESGTINVVETTDRKADFKQEKCIITVVSEDCETMMEQVNNSYLNQLSVCSNISNISDLSFNLSEDQEVEKYTNGAIDSDELPIFEIRLMSPMGRSPSPINSVPTDLKKDDSLLIVNIENNVKHLSLPHMNNSEFVALQDINAQISPPSESNVNITENKDSLETIFEGVFLHTPPRRRSQNRVHANLLEKAKKNRFIGKENYSPTQNSPAEKTRARQQE